jgi:hypothetical protein
VRPIRSATRREAALLGIAEQGMQDVGVLGCDRPQIESLGPDVLEVAHRASAPIARMRGPSGSRATAMRSPYGASSGESVAAPPVGAALLAFAPLDE